MVSKKKMRRKVCKVATFTGNGMAGTLTTRIDKGKDIDNAMSAIRQVLKDARIGDQINVDIGCMAKDEYDRLPEMS